MDAPETLVGATWGVGYDRVDQDAYLATVLKRHSDFGQLGIGGIYQVDYDAAGNVQQIVQWANVPNVGVMSPRNLPTNSTAPSYDVEAYTLAGKVGLGDIEVTNDGNTLYVMNLNDNGALVEYDTATATINNTYPIDDPGCAAATDVRPWAIHIDADDNVLIGVVCSEESTQVDANMVAYVMALTPGSGLGNFTTVTSIALDYLKEPVAPSFSGCTHTNQWYAWDSDPANFGSRSAPDQYCETVNYGSEQDVLGYPMPILSDIEVDTDGSFILGFIDRFALQTGQGNYRPDATETDTSLYTVNAGGDILRICNVNGLYVPEGGTGCEYNDTTEYYGGDDFRYGTGIAHAETALGGLALLASADDVLTVVYDPIDDIGQTNQQFATGGIATLDNTTGVKESSYRVVDPGQVFGKAGSLGDIELFCHLAPLEIGNSVWLDEDEDGIQDPCEPAIAGVDVVLTAADGSTQTTTTDANGEYYFPVDANSAYTLTIDMTQPELITATLTTPNVDAGTTLTDGIDSDAVANGSLAVITLTTGDAGENDHTFDFGFYEVIPPLTINKTVSTAEPVSVGQPVLFTIRITNTGDVTITTLPLSDTYDTTYLSYNSLVGSTPATTDNASDGQLDWSDLTVTEGDLAPGDVIEVIVNFTAAADTSALAVAQAPCLNAGETCNVATVDGAMAGTDPVPTVTDSDDVEIEELITGKSTLGDFVWFDTNSDGIKDPGETGINGVVINLYDSTGLVTTTVTMSDTGGIGDDTGTTNGAGFYDFEVLASTVYTVEIDPSNFAPGGALEGYTYTGNNASQLYSGDETRVVGMPAVQHDENNVDFGYVTHSLGNYVWLDADNSGDVTAGEQPVPDGVVIELLNSGGTVVMSTTTTSGYYLFDGLAAGDYQVRVAASNFQSGGLLENHTDSTGAAQEADPNSDGDQNDNGIDGGLLTTDGIVSAVVTIGGSEPMGETATASGNAGDDGAGTPDINSNLTVDFGLYPPIMSFELSKTLNTPSPARVGEKISFTIRITNTGTAIMTHVPLTDTYDNFYMSYTAVASPEPDIPTVGELVWSDLTTSGASGFGMDLNPGETFAVTVEFITKIDTTGLPNESTLNIASSQGITDTAEAQAFSPTSVEFTLREALYESGKVVVRWETADESDVVGFHIYREVIGDDDSEPIKLTPEMLFAEKSGSPSGASYSYEDESADVSVDYRYFVESIDSNGLEIRQPLGEVTTRRTVDVWFIFLPLTVK